MFTHSYVLKIMKESAVDSRRSSDNDDQGDKENRHIKIRHSKILQCLHIIKNLLL